MRKPASLCVCLVLLLCTGCLTIQIDFMNLSNADAHMFCLEEGQLAGEAASDENLVDANFGMGFAEIPLPLSDDEMKAIVVVDPDTLQILDSCDIVVPEAGSIDVVWDGNEIVCEVDEISIAQALLAFLLDILNPI